MITLVKNKSGLPVAVISGADLAELAVYASRLQDDPTEHGTSRTFWRKLRSVLTSGISDERAEAERIGREAE